jgi:uncharacterized protein (DUF58 family)
MRRTKGRLYFSLTDAGKVILKGTGFVALAALIVPSFGVLAALISVAIIALLMGYVLRPKIEVSGNLPDRIVAGQTTQLKFMIKNIARLPAYNLCLRFNALPKTIEQTGNNMVISRLGPGETAEVTVSIRPKRRGHYQIRQPICLSSFPFNLFNFGISQDREENLIVLPAFYQLHMPQRHLSRYVGASGMRFTGRTGASLQYAGNRPFQPGDSPRKIDARAWARLAMPATKEYHDDFDKYVALVLDTGVPEIRRRSKSNEIKELEAAISLCASVALTIHKECLVDMLLAGPDLHKFATYPKTVRLDKIHEILAGIEPSKSYSLEQSTLTLTERFYEISEVFFILRSWNKPYSKLLESACQAGCHCTVLMIGEPRKINTDKYNLNWTGNVQFISADNILKGQIKQL